MRVVIYARVSTADQETENQSVQLREYCARQGWTVVREYSEQISGGKSDRPQFRAMMDAASRREFDAVLTWALDRLTREGVCETFEYVKRLKAHGVEYLSYTESHFRTTGPAGELMIAIAAWIAQQEKVRRSERTKAGLERAVREGKALGRPRKVFRRDEAERMRAEGVSWRKISEELGVKVSTIRTALAKEGK